MTWLALSLTAILLGAPPSDGGVYLDVPFVYQSPRQCGPAALTMVLRYWGHEVKHPALAAVISTGAQGASGADLERLARTRGSPTRAFVGTEEQLQRLLESGRPVIAALAPSPPTGPNHFVVVVGATPRDWVVHDPASGPYRRIPKMAFASRWKRLRHWSLLVDRAAAPAPAAATQALQPSGAPAGQPYWELASYYFRERRYDDARAVVQDGLAHAQGDAYGHDFLATLLQLDGRTLEALHHWNTIGSPVIRSVSYRAPDGASAGDLSRLYRMNEGDLLTREKWIDAGWLQQQLLPRQRIRWDLIPLDDTHWTLNVEAANHPLRSWKVRAIQNALTAVLDREISLDAATMDGVAASLALRLDPARRRLRAGAQRLFPAGPIDRLRVTADIRNEAWAAPGQTAALRVRSGEAALSYDRFLTSRRVLSAGLAFLRHADASFVVASLDWEKTAGLDVADRVRLRGRIRTETFVPMSVRSTSAQRLLASTAFCWEPGGHAGTLGVQVSAGATRGELPRERQFVLGVGPDVPLRLRAHPVVDGGLMGRSPIGQRFGLVNVDVQRRLVRAGWIDLRGLLFADLAAVDDRSYTDAGGGIRLNAAGQAIDILAARDVGGSRTRLWVGLTREF